MKNLTIIFLVPLLLLAQPATPPGTVKLSDLRVVEGKVYNPKLSNLWIKFDVECLRVMEDGIVAEEIVYQRIDAPSAPGNPLQTTGAYGAPPLRRVIAEKRLPGKIILIRNFPATLRPRAGQKLSGYALPIGKATREGITLPLWDYGTAYTPTNTPAAKP